MIGCIQYRNTEHNFVHIEEMEEVTRPDGTKAYDIVSIPGPTPITIADAPNFTFDFSRRVSDGTPQFYAIKTKNTGVGGTSPWVEIHVIPRKDKVYQTFSHHVVTPFQVADAPNFDFVIGKGEGDLIGIKRRNTASGKVEMHVVSRRSGYKEFSLHRPIDIPIADAPNWVFGSNIWDNVVGIKVANTAGTVEVHVPKNSTEWHLQNISGFGLHLVAGRTFLIDPFFGDSLPPRLFGITSEPRPGFVEVRRGDTWWTGFLAPPDKFRSNMSTTVVGDFTFKMIGEPITASGGLAGL